MTKYIDLWRKEHLVGNYLSKLEWDALTKEEQCFHTLKGITCVPEFTFENMRRMIDRAMNNTLEDK